MARSIKEIQQNITGLLVSEMAAAGKTINPDNWSQVNLLRLLCYVYAVAGWMLEGIFDLLKYDTTTYIATMKPHRTRWYATKALMYQHGFPLIDDSDLFDNTGKTDQQIQASKIVKYAACLEETTQHGRLVLRIKLAGQDSTDLQPLTVPQLDGVKEYFKRIKDAGVPLEIESNPPDLMRMKWVVYYDPLILDNEGNRLDGTGDDVVRTAIKEYLTMLPFNGVYAVQKHEDHVQQVDGVVLCPIQYAQKKFGVYDWQYISIMTTPDAGYMRFENDEALEIEYRQQGTLN